jgi:hypothetical protein
MHTQGLAQRLCHNDMLNIRHIKATGENIAANQYINTGIRLAKVCDDLLLIFIAVFITNSNCVFTDLRKFAR